MGGNKALNAREGFYKDSGHFTPLQLRGGQTKAFTFADARAVRSMAL